VFIILKRTLHLQTKKWLDKKDMDTYRHKGLRKKLVETLRTKGIKDENVLKAIENVPRHLFMDSSFVEFAYKDSAFPIAAGQTISQPYTVAYQTELLEVKWGDKVLEIGTGSGYQSCVLCEMGAKVFSIERQMTLFKQTKVLLPKIGYTPKLFFGDGYAGLPTFGPFNKIIVTAAAPEIPEKLIEQLKVGGMMVIPLNSAKGDYQIMKKVVKLADGSLNVVELDTFRFVPLLQNKSFEGFDER